MEIQYILLKRFVHRDNAKSWRPSIVTNCEYCDKKLVILDGNKMVLEVNGSYRKACRGCAEKLSQRFPIPTPGT